MDVGCGPGNSTAALAAAFPDAEVLGVDNSPEMLDAARGAHPGLSFAHADAAGGLAELPGSFDVVFSNACLQWVPDHPALLARLMRKVAPGGVLAVQVPVNYDEPVHRIIREIVARPAWRGAFPQPRVLHTLAPEEYFLTFTGGHKLFKGKIVDVLRETRGAFNFGRVVLEGIGEDRGSQASVEFQNENLACTVDGEIVATVPDLICLVDPDTFTPVPTDGLKYGKRVLAVGLECFDMWRTPAGIELVGPRYFGIDADYIPVEERCARKGA